MYILSTKKFLIENRKVKNHIIGDFNINIMSNDVQKYENNINQVFLSNFLAHEYFPCFTDITRPSTIGHGGTCIDNVFIKSNTINIVSYEIANPSNDHFPLFEKCNNVKFSPNDNNRINNRINNRMNERINYDKLKEIANDVDCNSILTIQEPNCATDELITKINKCVENLICANKQKRSKRDKTPRKKWIAKAIIVSCKNKGMTI